MYTSIERFHDANFLLSAIESRTVRESRMAFAWQMEQRARRTRRERIIEYVATTIAAAAWVGTILVVSGMLFTVGTDF
nr:MAG TPA: hypothetical protein [Caudoviricetes sp.]